MARSGIVPDQVPLRLGVEFFGAHSHFSAPGSSTPLERTNLARGLVSGNGSSGSFILAGWRLDCIGTGRRELRPLLLAGIGPEAN